jgi:DNA repair protein RadA/Sms
MSEFDRVLGGGLVAGQVVLLAGEPGVGKSTLLLAVADVFATGTADQSARNVLYVSGEESAEQIGIRAQRIGAAAETLLVADESGVEEVLDQWRRAGPTSSSSTPCRRCALVRSRAEPAGSPKCWR